MNKYLFLLSCWGLRVIYPSGNSIIKVEGVRMDIEPHKSLLVLSIQVKYYQVTTRKKKRKDCSHVSVIRINAVLDIKRGKKVKLFLIPDICRRRRTLAYTLDLWNCCELLFYIANYSSIKRVKVLQIYLDIDR